MGDFSALTIFSLKRKTSQNKIDGCPFPSSRQQLKATPHKACAQIARQIFRQIVQGRHRRADARQGQLVQYDGKYASKMRAKREARALCGVALKKIQNFR